MASIESDTTNSKAHMYTIEDSIIGDDSATVMRGNRAINEAVNKPKSTKCVEIRNIRPTNNWKD
jgi:hypothetical protein